MRRISTVLVVSLVLGLGGACSGSESGSNQGTTDTSGSESTTIDGGADSPEDAVTAYIEAATLDQWGRVYDGLHPEQQALFSKEEFVSCSNQIPAEFEGLEVIDTYEEPSALPGVAESVPSTAVTVKVTLASGTQTLTAHAYEVGGRWWSSVDEDTIERCTA